MDPNTLALALGGIGTAGAAIAGGWNAYRGARRTSSRDGVEDVRDSAEIDLISALQSENGQLRLRHDAIWGEYTGAVARIGELSAKVAGQSAHIGMLETQVSALTAMVAEQTGTIDNLYKRMGDFIDRATHDRGAPDRHETGPIDWPGVEGIPGKPHN